MPEDKGAKFTDNTVFYDSEVSPSSVEFPESGVTVAAREKVPMSPASTNP